MNGHRESGGRSSSEEPRSKFTPALVVDLTRLRGIWTAIPKAVAALPFEEKENRYLLGGTNIAGPINKPVSSVHSNK